MSLLIRSTREKPVMELLLTSVSGGPMASNLYGDVASLGPFYPTSTLVGPGDPQSCVRDVRAVVKT